MSKDIMDHEPHWRCPNCGHACHERDATPISDIFERVEPGEIMPAGECPLCGALLESTDPDWYIVVGRVTFDDEDTLLILQASSESEAEDLYEKEMQQTIPVDGPEGACPFVNYVVRCGPCEPCIVRSI